MAIGKNLKAILKYKDMTAKELAEKSGVSVNTLYGIIQRDNSTIKPDIDAKISNVLEIRPYSLSMLSDLSHTITTLILEVLDHNDLNDESAGCTHPFNEALVYELSNSTKTKDIFRNIMAVIDVDNEHPYYVTFFIHHLYYFCMLTPKQETPIYNTLEYLFKKMPEYYKIVGDLLTNYYIIFDIIWDNSGTSPPVSDCLDGLDLIKNSDENSFYLEKLVYNNCEEIEFGYANHSNTVSADDSSIKKNLKCKDSQLMPYIKPSYQKSYKKVFQSLNDKGQEKLLEQARLLAKIPDYQADNPKKNTSMDDSGDTADNDEF
jgi:transcriptional regulator with XRE-family HTH domain